METAMLVLVVMFIAADGVSSGNLPESSPSVAVPASGCPMAVNWTGVDAKSCVDQQCSDHQECNQTGVQGLCCQTSCAGRNCFYDTTTLPRGRRSAGECPRDWQGHQCGHNTCSMDHQCMQHGKKAYCCPTKCGKHNCYMPNMGKRSVEPEEDCPLRSKRSSHMCPSKWQGSKCGQNTCSSNGQCKKLGAKWFCCPTKCGKKNCYKSG